MPASNPLKAYEEFQDAFAADVKSAANQESLGKIFEASCRYLAKLKTVELKSLVSGKEYFAFVANRKVSRAVNKRLFQSDPGVWNAFRQATPARRASDMDAERITQSFIPWQ
jgi:hypothetical protein